jgi:hypothetical protein
MMQTRAATVDTERYARCISYAGCQLPQRFAVSRILVGVDHLRWPVLARSQRLCQKTPGCLGIAAVSRKSTVRPCLSTLETVTSTIRYPNARLVDSPGAAGVALAPSAESTARWLCDRPVALARHFYSTTLSRDGS